MSNTPKTYEKWYSRPNTSLNLVVRAMAGHSQFKNIMHRKGRQDAQRAKVFTKIIREITTAARLGAADPNANPRLRAAAAYPLDCSILYPTGSIYTY